MFPSLTLGGSSLMIRRNEDMSARHGTSVTRLSEKSLSGIRTFLPEARQPSTCRKAVRDLSFGRQDRNLLQILIHPPNGLFKYKRQNKQSSPETLTGIIVRAIISPIRLSHGPWRPLCALTTKAELKSFPKPGRREASSRFGTICSNRRLNRPTYRNSQLSP
jgi:hypothetical protein